MKSRIMLYLFQLSTGKSCPVLDALMTETGFPEEKVRKNAGTVLSNILHNYPLFSVKTIDSFFQNVVQAFAKELGLQGGFEIELDQEKVLDDLVDRVMVDAGRNRDLTDWLVRFTEARLHEGKSWDVRQEIKKLAWEIFNEHFKIFDHDIREKKRAAPELLKATSAISTAFEKELAAQGKKALALAAQRDLKVNQFSYGPTGVMGYMQKLSKGQISKPGLRVQRAALNADELYKKGDPLRESIIRLYQDGLQQIICRVLDLFEKDHTVYLSAIAIQRYIYTLGILSDISLKLQDYREDNQSLLISDLADFLKKVIQENDAPFIYEKTGSRYRHFMIDECQDTSGFQWNNFKPLIANSLSEGNLNLAVGDVKQSIYRWRGGNWELLLRQIQEDIGTANVEKLNLDTNRRSKRTLIRFFNSVFSKAPSALKDLFVRAISNLDEPLSHSLSLEAEKITQAYSDSLQRIPVERLQDDNEGFVNARFFEDEEEFPWQEKVLKTIPQTLETLQDHGYALKDVAFLVRKKEEGEQIINFLIQHQRSPEAREGYRYEAISSESLFLTAAHSVRVLLNLFQYLYNPDNSIALFNAVYIYQLHILQNTAFADPDIITLANRPAFIREKELLPSSFFEDRDMLKALPLYELSEMLIRMFRLETMRGEWMFLQAFLDLVLEFSRKERGDLDKFLDWWENTGVSRSIQLPEEVDAARILTIHKSKGLQFKAVIIPFCSWDLDHNPSFDNIIWVSSDRQPFNMLSRLPVKYTSALSESLFSREYYGEKLRCSIDNINLLYVALTRAEDALFISACLPSPNRMEEGQVKNASDLLLQVFSETAIIESSSGYETIPLNQYWNPSENVFKAGALVSQSDKRQAREETEPLDAFLSSDWRKKISVRFSAKDRLEGMEAKQEKIRYGKLIHRMLARAKTMQDLSKILKEYYFEGFLSQTELVELENKMNKVFENEQARDWFSGRYRVKTEASTLQPGGGMRRIDRAMILDDQAIAVDFKTGMKNPGDWKQVGDYAALLKDMGYQKVEAYLLYLDEVEVIRVI